MAVIRPFKIIFKNILINRSKIDDGLNYPVFLFQNFQIFCLLSRRHFPCPSLFTKGQLKGQRPAEVTGVVTAVIRWHSKVTVSPPSSGRETCSGWAVGS